MNWEIVKNHITPDIVIDCGANRGYFYQDAKTHWQDAYYLLIEANQECQPCLEQLGVDYSIAVLSDEDDKLVTLYTLKDSPCATGASVYRENTDFFKGENAVEHKLHTRTLDEVCSQIDFTGKKSLLKIDCQGSELDILKGGRIVLENCTGLIVEVADVEYNQGAPNRKEVEAYLVDHGFDNMGEVDTLVHPTSQEEVQHDVFFLRR